ncbi:MAG: tetratricopeptide repeat protein [Thermoflexales bacterium]|nr:tetratricopeptide repeat protein [Thermoflexales bacterium]
MPAITLAPQVQAYLDEGQQHEQAGLAEAASQAYRSALQLEPRCDAAWLALVGSLVRENKWDEALTTGRTALQAFSNVRADGYDLPLNILGQLHELMARIYHQRGLAEQAILELKMAVYYLPKNRPAHHELGTLCWEEGYLEEATRYLARALELQYNAPDTLRAFQQALARRRALEAQKIPQAVREAFDQALAAYHQRELAKAHKQLQAIVRSAPEHAQAWCYLGLCQLGLKEPAGLNTIEQAARLASDNAQVLKHLARSYVTLGQAEQAISVYLRAIQVQPNDIEAYVELGAMYQQQGRWVAAFEVLKRARYFDQEGLFDRRALLTFCQAWVRAQANNGRAHYELAVRHIATDNWPAALSELMAALRYGFDQPDVYTYMSLALIESQDWGRALEALKTAVSRQPNWWLLHALFAYTFFNGLQDAKRALAACKAATRCLEQPDQAPGLASQRRLVRQMSQKIAYPSRDDGSFWKAAGRQLRGEVSYGL